YSGLNTVINYLLDEAQFLYLVMDVHMKEDQHTAQNIAKGINK
ncbi:15887_t:CDS:2, partial [Dentiscutata heterogama]